MRTSAGEQQVARLNAGFSLYILLRQLLDFEANEAAAQPGMSRRVKEVFLEEWFQPAHEYYKGLVGSVEIFNQAGHLERVFFRFPKICHSLTDERKEQLEWTVDRETPGAQLIQFIEVSARCGMTP